MKHYPRLKEPDTEVGNNTIIKDTQVNANASTTRYAFVVVLFQDGKDAILF